MLFLLDVHVCTFDVIALYSNSVHHMHICHHVFFQPGIFVFINANPQCHCVLEHDLQHRSVFDENVDARLFLSI